MYQLRGVFYLKLFLMVVNTRKPQKSFLEGENNPLEFILMGNFPLGEV